MAEELIGVIGGTGLGDALAEKLTDAESHDIETPFGKPSTNIIVGTLGKKQVAFLNRHGTGHKLSPSDVPHAANIFALKKLGVRAVIGSGAVGSLREEIAPGHLVVVDQFIDKTFKRVNTFFSLRSVANGTAGYRKDNRCQHASRGNLRLYGRTPVLHAGRIPYAPCLGR
jgi:5'-methylthioadenosine phosphorylase